MKLIFWEGGAGVMARTRRKDLGQMEEVHKEVIETGLRIWQLQEGGWSVEK
jgi:hypothetical protein